jgi:hypothetical protein
MAQPIGEYNGASLHSFVLALGHSEPVVQKLLRERGVDRLDPNRWYEMKWAIGVYYAVGQQIGRSALIEVGKKIIETAEFPPGLDDIHALLSSLDAAYRLNCRGPDIGAITCEFEDDHNAVLEWTTLGPCALNIGIIEGCCARVGKRALVEHGAGGCMDEGGPSCVYRVSF